MTRCFRCNLKTDGSYRWYSQSTCFSCFEIVRDMGEVSHMFLMDEDLDQVPCQ